VHAVGIAPDTKEAFYFKCGFDEIVEYITDGEGNPLGLAKVSDGAIMSMWREGALKHCR